MQKNGQGPINNWYLPVHPLQLARGASRRSRRPGPGLRPPNQSFPIECPTSGRPPKVGLGRSPAVRLEKIIGNLMESSWKIIGKYCQELLSETIGSSRRILGILETNSNTPGGQRVVSLGPKMGSFWIFQGPRGAQAGPGRPPGGPGKLREAS